ncbi:glucosamine-6-phosphate deaminase [Rhodopirellula sp. MGV]|uniref:glucosamine-6-phosphate deaminase n=1 Tax=Rhodopirellula sp. MGV TaxID=2023130 RepID=UPI000B95FE8E|nr:glucosamine-6-phosphate deaminase [Rhodopirellula sp. MGV]OYP28293.1 glucosamine-6-phosphate deaminase [Rhodopirellula sp. MGV]PNY38829.1 glucosamine-6-phosphate deaminase [Rhodopirellula baltica]
MGVSTTINGISVLVCDTAEAASEATAKLIANQLNANPRCVLGLATGGTPLMTYQSLIAMNQSGQCSFQNATTFNLDEYVGLAADHPQSYRSFMNDNLFSKIDVPIEQTYVPDGLADNIAEHCSQYEAMIDRHGGIDLQLLGIGHNGHIAFNEPGSDSQTKTRLVDLAGNTIEQNARFFSSADEVPRQAITMGIATILKAKQIVLLAMGSGKVDAVNAMLLGEVSADVPASFLREHPAVTVVLDRDAAAGLGIDTTRKMPTEQQTT